MSNTGQHVYGSQPSASDRVIQAREIFVRLCAEAEAQLDAPLALGAALALRERLFRRARVEAGLPAKTPWEIYMDKLDRKRRVRQKQERREARRQRNLERSAL